MAEPLDVDTAGAVLEGDLVLPSGAWGLVVFAHGSGSSRHSPRNHAVASALADAGLATFLFDLLQADEDRVDRRTREFRFDIALLTPRLVGAVEQLAVHASTAGLPVGVFGASTGAAVALQAAAHRPDLVRAVVSRGGRPDLAGELLPLVTAPTLLVVGSRDHQVLELNRFATQDLPAAELATVDGATHLFSESGALEQVTDLALEWFRCHLI